MTSVILRTATIILLPLTLLFSLFIFWRGHNEPGGGFIGGLVAATAFSLYALAFDVSSARRLLHMHVKQLMGIGIGIAALAGVLGLVAGRPFMTGLWPDAIKVGTPVLFDLGVFLTVISVVLTFIFTLAEEE